MSSQPYVDGMSFEFRTKFVKGFVGLSISLYGSVTMEKLGTTAYAITIANLYLALAYKRYFAAYCSCSDLELHKFLPCTDSEEEMD